MKMSSAQNLNTTMSQETALGLKLWAVIGICVAIFTVLILAILAMWVALRRKSRRTTAVTVATNNKNKNHLHSQIPIISKEITVDRGNARTLAQSFRDQHQLLRTNSNKDVDNVSQCSSSVYHNDKFGSSASGDEGGSSCYSGHVSTAKVKQDFAQQQSHEMVVSASPLVGFPGFSQLGWGHWFTLRDLEYATNRFSKENVIGEGGYGVVYRGDLMNGTQVAVKKILNNMYVSCFCYFALFKTLSQFLLTTMTCRGQAEREFRVEVEAIGHVRHKNLVRLLGYCIEGIHRYCS